MFIEEAAIAGTLESGGVQVMVMYWYTVLLNVVF